MSEQDAVFRKPGAPFIYQGRTGSVSIFEPMQPKLPHLIEVKMGTESRLLSLTVETRDSGANFNDDPLVFGLLWDDEDLLRNGVLSTMKTGLIAVHAEYLHKFEDSPRRLARRVVTGLQERDAGPWVDPSLEPGLTAAFERIFLLLKMPVAAEDALSGVALADYVENLTFKRMDVRCKVTAISGNGELAEELRAQITKLLEVDASNILGLTTGQIRGGVNGMVSLQNERGISFRFLERAGRAVQNLLRKMIEQNISVDLLFIEPDATLRGATYAWNFHDVKPQSTGSDDTGKDFEQTNPWEVTYEVAFEGKFIDDLNGALQEATAVLAQ